MRRWVGALRGLLRGFRAPEEFDPIPLATRAQRVFWQLNHAFNSAFPGHDLLIVRDPHQAELIRVHSRDGAQGLTLRVLEKGLFQLCDLEGRPGGQPLPNLQLLLFQALGQMAPAALKLDEKSRPPLILEGHSVLRKIDFRRQWSSPRHRSGWKWAVACLEELHHPQGVILDGFLEATFCWGDKGVIYDRPWIGFVHNPPDMPPEAGNGKSSNQALLANPAFRKSLRHCQGLFCLSASHARRLAQEVEVPVEALVLPTESPELKFSLQAFRQNSQRRLIQIGSWLRHPNSIYELKTRLPRAKLDPGYPWEEKLRRDLGLDTPPEEGVAVLPFINDREYDRLLSCNLAFAHMFDSSANNLVIECIVRHTPLLINRLPALEEYLGPEYPFFFNDLHEAARLADSEECIEAAHRYLVQLPKERFTREHFLRSFVQSSIYQSLPSTTRERFVLLAHARSGSTTLSKVLSLHPQVSMIHEPFNPERDRWGKFNYASESRDSAALAASLEEIWTHHQGIKHLDTQLDQAGNEQLLASAHKVLLLHRQNLLEAALSEWLAIHSGSWNLDREVLLRSTIPSLDSAWVLRLISQRTQRLEGHRQFLQSANIPYLEVTYEELYSPSLSWDERRGSLLKVFQFLALPVPQARLWEEVEKLLSPDQKLNNQETHRLIPNLEAVLQQVEERIGVRL